MTAVYSEKDKLNAEFLNVKADGKYCNDSI